MASWKTIETAKIKLEGEKAEFTAPAQLQLPSQYMEVLEGDHVNVTVYIKEIILSKEFRDVDIVPRISENSNTLQLPSLSTLVFNGPYKTINDLTSNDVKVFIDGTEMGESRQKRLRVKVQYPSSDLLKLTKTSPRSVRVRVKPPPRKNPPRRKS